jgi:hypothetical protein
MVLSSEMSFWSPGVGLTSSTGTINILIHQAVVCQGLDLEGCFEKSVTGTKNYIPL